MIPRSGTDPACYLGHPYRGIHGNNTKYEAASLFLFQLTLSQAEANIARFTQSMGSQNVATT